MNRLRRHDGLRMAVAAAGVTWLFGSPLRGQEQKPDGHLGAWFVDLGRDYALSHAESAVEADAAVALCFMKAAARLQPDLADAYYWQLDLLKALDRDREALDALEKYVQHQPEDHLARLMLVDTRISRLQTAEDRRAFCERYLDHAGLGRALRSDLHRRIAEFHYNRAEFDKTREHIERSLEAYSLNLAATRLRHELNESDGTPADRVDLFLQMLAANPAQPVVLWELANYLSSLSLHAGANVWYAYAAEVIPLTQPGAEVPLGLLFDWAVSQRDGGEPEAAQQTCRMILDRDASRAQARMLLMEIGQASGKPDLAAEQAEFFQEQYRRMTSEVRKTNDVARAAEMAWFYARYAPNKELASGFARIADAEPTSELFVRRAVGYAHLVNERYEPAIESLEPLAGVDPWAALGLSRAYESTGNAAEALAVLQRAVKLRFSGPAYEAIRARIEKLGAEPPVRPDHTAVKNALARFDRRILDFFRRPNDFVKLEMIPSQREWAFGRPWRMAFRLKNTGPFPITLGHDRMILPRLSLSAELNGTQPGRYDHYLRFGLNRRPALLPNEFIEVTTTVDVGPIRRASFLSAQLRRDITFRLLLDPIQSADGTWTHRLSGLSVEPVTVTRLPADGDEPAVAVLLSKASGGKPAERAAAVTALAALLAEQDRIEAGAKPYDRFHVPERYIVKMLVDRAGDESPRVRISALNAMRYLDPRDALVQAAAPRLSDPTWTVRFLALYALAETQGETFSKVLARTAQTDPDPLLREFSSAYLQRFSTESATSAPAAPASR